MYCPTADLSEAPEADNLTLVTSLRFILDGITMAQEFPEYHPDLSNLTYHPDPVFHAFLNEIVYLSPAESSFTIYVSEFSVN